MNREIVCLFRKMFIGGHENKQIDDTYLLEEALNKLIYWRSKVVAFFSKNN